MSYKIAAVFIGTVVGAGLASGQEILQFFTLYGFNSIFGIIICGAFYIITGIMTMNLSYKFGVSTYKDLIYLSCGKYLGWVVDALTTFFLFGGTCIILAGSGSIFLEFLGLPRILGIIVMAAATIVVVLYSTDGLLFINSIIVPCMILVIIIISVIVVKDRISSGLPIWYDIKNATVYKPNWLSSTFLYSAFNMLFATGVLCPITRDIKKSRGVFTGIVLGAIGLFLLTLTINIILMINEPNVFKLSIPMLYIAKGVGAAAGIALSVVIWLEMFSTAVSNVYSLAKTMHHNFKINYNLSVLLLPILAYPFTSIGFENLIKILYPAFGVISIVYITCMVRLYIKSKKKPLTS
jgi:uncharacterized membrane protein YkvI